MEKVRFGVLGAARIALEKVIPAMQRGQRTEVVAIASRDRHLASAAAEQLGLARFHGSYQELLDDPAIDAVYIPLPNHLHVEWAKNALAAGLHVLCEKPFTANAAEAREIAELAAKSDRVVMEAFHYRYHPLTLRVEQIVASGELGKLKRGKHNLHILDEPTTGLDEHAFRETWACIEALRRDEGVSVLVATHRADEAARCDRVAIVDHGSVIAQGTPQELCSRVAGDVLVLHADALDEVARVLRDALQLDSRQVDGALVIERAQGHELVPRIIDTLGPGRVRALSMRQPTLADVFVKLTGRALGQEVVRND